jgi:SAM-dependent methyltransferase
VSGQRYCVYDRFAWFYNRDWGSDYHGQAQPALENLLFSRLRPGARVLDLCCGTGDLTRSLAARGYQVTGLDGSAEMLRYAGENVPEAEFILADARDFSLPPVFEGAVSTFDSLNHILSLRELAAVFHNVFRALTPAGRFVFDMNMEASFRTLWHGSSAIVEEKNVCITRGSYDQAEKMGRADVTTFRLAGTCWERSDITVFERCYSAVEIRSGLADAGFAEIHCWDARELQMLGDIGLGRSFFSAVKPRGLRQ